MHGDSNDDCSVENCKHQIPNLKLFMPFIRITVEKKTKTELIRKVQFNVIPVISRLVGSLTVKRELKSRGSKVSDQRARLIIGTDINAYLIETVYVHICVIEADIILGSVVIDDLQVVVSTVQRLLEGGIIEVAIEYFVLIYDRVNSFWQYIRVDDSNIGVHRLSFYLAEKDDEDRDLQIKSTHSDDIKY